MTWTSWDAEQRLIEASRTIARLPPGEWTRLAALRVSWPQYTHDRQIVYGWEPARKGRILPTMAEITRMDETMAWVSTLLGPGTIEEKRDRVPSDVARVLWLRAGHATWERIAEARIDVWGRHRGRGGPSAVPMGNSTPSLRRIHKAGLALLASRLDAAGIENPDAAETPEESAEQRRRQRPRAPDHHQERRVTVRYDVTDAKTGTPTSARATVQTKRAPLVMPEKEK